MQQNILSPEVKSFLKSRFVELFALGLFFFSIALLTGLLSYNPKDNSLNTIGGSVPQNIMGLWGSYTADFLFQFFGLTVFLLPVVLLVWSVQIFLHKAPRYFIARIFALFFALALLSSYSQQWILDQLNFGLISSKGAIGLIIYDQTTSLLKQWALSDLTFYVFSTTCLIVLLSFLFNLTLARWINIFAIIGRMILRFFSKVFSLLSKNKEQKKASQDIVRPDLNAYIRRSFFSQSFCCFGKSKLFKAGAI